MESGNRTQEQIDWLRELADVIWFDWSDEKTGTLEERVDYWLVAMLELPSWFSGHDHRLLSHLVTSRADQIDWLRELADNIDFYAEASTPEEQVAQQLANLELPSWFGDHDRRVLIRWAASRRDNVWKADYES